MPGLLTFNGTIDLTQFWPENIKAGNTLDSDADTVKVKVDMATIIFTSAAGKIKKTKALNNAGFWTNEKKSDGTTVKKFKPVINSKSLVTMRLQGIDAPELHYMTGTPLYRQHMGETSTVQLYKYLQSQTKDTTLACSVFTQVDEPNDVFDKYGRCVGDINIVNSKGKTVDVNHWLIENGYAFPAFYNSMTNQEIQDIVNLAKNAMQNKLGIWKYASYKMAALDRTLIHSKKDGSYSAKADKKPPVIFPKLFRRLWEFEIKDKKTFSALGYETFLQGNKDDKCCLTSVFLASGYPKKSPLLADFVKSDGTINFKPADVVFKEAGTTLKDDKGNVITKF
ncbi:MAG: thermonuclease family protein [Bacteroidetes bacterium]|nr:thermonuclease family protein [Bacteroidota bacterium]